MDPLSRLPPECLQGIIRILFEENSTADLANLLQVNKYLAAATLPYLYADPFQISFHIGNGIKNLPVSIDSLVCMLLLARHCVETTELPKVVSVAYNLDAHNPKTLTSSPLDYLSHIQHLNLLAPEVYYSEMPGPIDPKISAYVREEGFQQSCNLYRFIPGCFQDEDEKMLLLLQQFRVDLLREANWAIAEPILEELQTLIIPVSDIKRYLGVVDRFTSLEHVRFCLDDIFDFDYTPDDIDEAESEEIVHAATQARKDEAMQGLVQFVKEHHQLFGSRLKTVVCPDSEIWAWAHQKFPEEIQVDISRILPPMHRPTLLNDVNWKQFVAHISATDLGYVQKISIDLASEPTRDRLYEHPDFLQRCRTLKHLMMDSLGQGTFKWAVQEKERIMESVSNSSIMDTSNAKQDISLLQDDNRPLYMRHGLVPLEKASITESDKMAFTDEIDDIAFAFCQTLKDLTINVPSESPFTPSDGPPRSIYVGQGWVDLPNLTDLYISVCEARLIIDRDLLGRCPNLVNIDLFDHTFEHTRQDVVPCLPAQLPRLESLTLFGWSALTFHPDTLHSTAGLYELCIQKQMGVDDVCFIASSSDDDDDLNDSFSAMDIQQPRWTWDWYLPLLTKLELNSDFAFRFQFKMLRGCPALKYLDLNMKTVEGRTRRIERSDLGIPSSDLDSKEPEAPAVAPGTLEPIVAPALWKLRMLGCWWMENDLLADFLLGMFPNLFELEAKNWIGVTLGEFLDVLRGTRTHRIESLLVDEGLLGDEDRLQLGLIPHYEDPEGRTLLSDLKVRIDYTKYYVLQETGSSSSSPSSPSSP
ncbi:hypothetical protein BGX23_006052 [Mortierella sp. AD031]|nr:hypothetical protein BGX23_006052 [Mortierella sp. AD031]